MDCSLRLRSSKPRSGCDSSIRNTLAWDGHFWKGSIDANPYGGRISLAVGFVATAVALVIGVSWGAIAGYFGGRVDSIMMRFVDIVYALPFMIFIILLMVVFGRNIVLLFVAIGAVEWLTHGSHHADAGPESKQQRICRGCGVAWPSTVFDYFQTHTAKRNWPNYCLHHFNHSKRYALEAFLSFLLGDTAPQTSWGLLISYGSETMEEYPWLLIFPGLALTITLFSLNFLGDGLRDALDVRNAKNNCMALLDVKNLQVSFSSKDEAHVAAKNVSFSSLTPMQSPQS